MTATAILKQINKQQAAQIEIVDEYFERIQSVITEMTQAYSPEQQIEFLGQLSEMCYHAYQDLGNKLDHS